MTHTLYTEFLTRATREYKLGFPTGRDSATFWDKGTEPPLLSRDKGTTGQDKKSCQRDRPGQPKFGTGRAGIAKNKDGTKRDRGK